MTSTTLNCSIRLGALIEAYNVTWNSTHVHDVRFDNTGEFPSLLILATIRGNEMHTCRVTVTNPIDGQTFSSERHFFIMPCKSDAGV